MTINDLFKRATGVTDTRSAKVTDSQWQTYLKFCNQKYVTPADRESFTSQTIGKEIERLFALPFARKAYPAQIKKFKESCEALGIKTPDDSVISAWSNIEISKRISVLGKRLPITEGQIRMLKNLYRFGLITESDMAGVDNQTAASDLISEHNEKYQEVSDGKLTIGQAEAIVELEAKLHGKTIDICDLSMLSFEDASDKVSALKDEQDEKRESYAYNWDNSDSMFNMDIDNSRSEDNEMNDTLSFADKSFKQKMTIVEKLQNIINIGHDDNEQLGEDDIDDTIMDLYELASVIGESSAAYNVMATAVEEGEPTKKAPKNKK